MNGRRIVGGYHWASGLEGILENRRSTANDIKRLMHSHNVSPAATQILANMLLRELEDIDKCHQLMDYRLASQARKEAA